MTPLLKKQGLDRNILRNYRPVSNLPFLSKIILSQLQTHLKENNFLEENQSAYRKYRSTETALLDVTSSLLDQADGGQVSALTLLDLSAAFDTLDHSILLRKLETTFGICGMALKWFDSYIRERFQSVVINGLPSKPALLQYSVPRDQCLALFCLLCTRSQYHMSCTNTSVAFTNSQMTLNSESQRCLVTSNCSLTVLNTVLRKSSSG